MMNISDHMLESERLQIVPFSESFLTPVYVRWLNDPETVAFSEQRHKTHTLESCRAYLNSFTGTPHRFCAIVRKSDGKHIGNINAYMDVNNRTADVGILIGERGVWGQGYGLEAWAVFCDALFNNAGIRKITAGAMACNQGMLRIFEKYGMQREGIRRRQFLCRGKEEDMVMVAKFSSPL